LFIGEFSPVDDPISKTVGGRYKVEAFLGKEDMAEVYKVCDNQRSVLCAPCHKNPSRRFGQGWGFIMLRVHAFEIFCAG
jgi:hypothetical protein